MGFNVGLPSRVPGSAVSRQTLGRRVPRIDHERLTDCGALEDEADVADAVLRGDFSALEYSLVALRQCRVAGVTFTGTRLARGSFVDCVVVDSDLSGAVLDDCRLERVEFRRCRLSGLQAQGNRFTDVGFFDSKIDGGNFRATVWERAEFWDSTLVESDFYGARLPGARLHGCNLAHVELSKCDLKGSRLQRSQLTGIRGGASLSGVTIGSDQIIPAALAVFDALRISLVDDD